MKRLAFNGGEITPAMALRSDMDVFPRSCTNLTNFDVLATGGISRRKGFSTICHADSEPSILIPYTYDTNHIYLVEISTWQIRIFDTATNTQVFQTSLRIESLDKDPRNITWLQINSLLILCAPSTPITQIKLNNDLSWSYSAFQFKCPPWQNIDLRDYEISITPTSGSHDYLITFPADTDTAENTPEHLDLLRASYFIPRQQTSGTGYLSTITTIPNGNGANSTANYSVGTKIAVASKYTTCYICVADFDASRDFVDGCTSPENYMAEGDARFIIAEDTSGFDNTPIIAGLDATTDYKKGAKIKVWHGYWKLFTCIRPYNGETDHITGNNHFEDYPSHFIAGIPIGDPLPCRGTWKFHCSDTWYGAYEVRRCYDSTELTALWETLGESFSPIGSPTNTILTGDEVDEECYLRLFITKTRYITDVDLASGWPTGSCQNSLIVSSYKHDMILKYNYHQNCYQDITPIKSELNSPYSTNDWSWAAFNSRNGYPTLACIHESRLIFASTPTQPQTIWMSKTDDLNNFQTGKLDTSALLLTMNTTTQAAICWLLSRGEVIMLGTEDAEWVISSTSGTGITPTTARIVNHGRVGSAHIPAVQAIDRVLYTERGSGRLYEYGFDWNSNSYISTDLTIFADHIAADAGGITSGTMQRKPYPRAIFVLADGTLALMTYNTHHQVNAWHRYTTNGKFESVCALPNGNNADKLYAITTRNGSRYLECLAPESDYLDAGQYDYTSTVSTTALWPPDADERKSPTAPLDAYITTPTPAANITIRTADTAPYSKLNHTGNMPLGWSHLIASATWTNRPHFSLRVTGNTPFTLLALQM